MPNDNKARGKDAVILIILNALLLAAAIAYKLIFDTGEPKFTCAFYDLTAIPCPACGGSRALFALLELKPLSAFLYFPPLILAVILIIKWDIVAAIHIITGGERAFAIKRAELIALPVALIAFFIIRVLLLLILRLDLLEIAASVNF